MSFFHQVRSAEMKWPRRAGERDRGRERRCELFGELHRQSVWRKCVDGALKALSRVACSVQLTIGGIMAGDPFLSRLLGVAHHIPP
jgi:hypothetical protein